jgi:hypothetical protein
MGAASRLMFCVALSILASLAPSQAQNRAADPYSNADIDAKIAELRRALDAEYASRVAAEAKVQVSLAVLPVELKGSEQANQNAVKAAEMGASSSADALGKRIDQVAALDDVKLQALSGKLPTTPWYASTLLGAILGALAAFFSSAFFAQQTRSENDRLRRRDAANDMCEQWRNMQGTVANALFLVGHPDRLVDPVSRNVVIDYGNWLNRLGVRWRLGDVDLPYLKTENLDGIVRDFWARIDAACAALRASAAPDQIAAAAAIEDKKRGWTAFQWLASQPP